MAPIKPTCVGDNQVKVHLIPRLRTSPAAELYKTSQNLLKTLVIGATLETY